MRLGWTVGRVPRRERVTGVALCALAVAAGQLLGGADADARGQGLPAPVPTADQGVLAAEGGRVRLPAGLDRYIAPDPGRAAPATPSAAATAPIDAPAGPGGASGRTAAAGCGAALGPCDAAALPPPADSDLAAQVRATGSAVPDHPGRYQVDPATGQVVDTGIASLPTEPVDVPVATTTTMPPPPGTEPIAPPPTEPPDSPPTAEADLGSAAGAPVG